MATQKIVSRWDSSKVLFECEIPDGLDSGLALRHALEKDIEARANLADANLAYAKGSELAIAMTRILPAGDLIGWKKCKYGVIVKLRVPAEAKRSHAFGRKCRAEYVDVLDVIGADVGISEHDSKTEYRPGQRVTPDSFDENWRGECSSGIHFFITREEAEAY